MAAVVELGVFERSAELIAWVLEYTDGLVAAMVGCAEHLVACASRHSYLPLGYLVWLSLSDDRSSVQTGAVETMMTVALTVPGLVRGR